MIDVTVFNQNTGEIKGVARVSPGSGATVVIDEYSGNIEGVSDSNEHYVSFENGNPFIKQKPSMNIVVNKDTIKANSTEEAIISNIPSGCSMTHDDETHIITDGVVEFTADHVGEYTFAFSLFPFKPVTITVEAVSP